MAEKSYALQLAEKYMETQPDEAARNAAHLRANNMSADAYWKDLERTFANWLEKLAKNPDRAIATGKTTWAAKVTQAYFALRGMKVSGKNKPFMLNLVKDDLMLHARYHRLIAEGEARTEAVGLFTVRGTNWCALVVRGDGTAAGSSTSFSNGAATEAELAAQPSAFLRALAWAKQQSAAA